MRILVVDGDDVASTSLRHLLKQHGYQVADLRRERASASGLAGEREPFGAREICLEAPHDDGSGTGPDAQAVITHSAHGVMVVDQHHRIIAFNPAIQRITGFTAGEMLGRTCSYLLGATMKDGGQLCDLACPFLALEGGGERYSPVEVEITTKQGNRVWVEATFGPMKGADGSLMGVVHTFTDTSVRKEIESAKEEFISLVSHELRTPLTSISGYTQLLIRRMAGEEARQEDLRALGSIRQQADRLGALIDGLLDVSRIQAGMMKLHRVPLHLPRLVSGVIASLQPLSPRHQLHFEEPAGLPSVQADPQRTEQVLLNLLDNAVKYSPEGGPIEVTLSLHGSLVVTSVRDHGIGIEGDALQKLFQRFHRVQNTPTSHLPGLGIGLYLSRMLVEAHGGAIWATSQVGQGSIFSFTLPLASCRATACDPG